jgi:quinol monooxygenase YgiN
MEVNDKKMIGGTMTIGIGRALARRFTAAGRRVAIAHSRGPETLSAPAAETGATALYVKDIISARRRAFPKNYAVLLFEPLFLHAFGLAFLLSIAGTSAARAQTSDEAIYGVTNIDVPPSATSRGIALLKHYRDAALKQPGNHGVDLLQQVGWPNRFVIYEAWKDQSAYDANEKAAHMSGFCDTLRSISNAPCDRHAYFVVSVGPARVSAGANPIYMMLHLDVFPNQLQTGFVVAKQVAEAARKGEGNLRYDVVSEVSTPLNYMTVFAAWQNRKAFDDYEMSTYARQFRDKVGQLLGSPFDDRLYTPIN